METGALPPVEVAVIRTGKVRDVGVREADATHRVHVSRRSASPATWNYQVSASAELAACRNREALPEIRSVTRLAGDFHHVDG